MNALHFIGVASGVFVVIFTFWAANAQAHKGGQSVKDSIIEAWVNVFIGFGIFRTPLINYKTNSGRVPLPDQGPRRQYEIILYAIKGKKPVTHIYPDVISSQSDENMSHGAQKPVAVYENLLQRSVRAGDVVLDCFAGTGPIFPAAHGLLCSAIGLELNPEYYAFALRRLQQLKESDQLGLDGLDGLV